MIAIRDKAQAAELEAVFRKLHGLPLPCGTTAWREIDSYFVVDVSEVPVTSGKLTSQELTRARQIIDAEKAEEPTTRERT